VARHKFRDFSNQISIAIGGRLLTPQRANDFRLSAIVDPAVAGKRGHDVTTVNTVDPLAGKIGERRKVLFRSKPLRLEATHLARRAAQPEVALPPAIQRIAGS
jgi:hypothetical protein